MNPFLDPFYPIVDSVDWIERLLPLGIKLVQLRIKDEPDDSVRRQIARAKALCEKRGCQLIVNDYWRAAIDAGCDFVHLGQGDLDTADTLAIRKAGIRLGISTHDHAELDRALAHDPDYVALGPIYPTILKKMTWAPQGPERIGEWKKLIGERPLVAIGGLKVEHLACVFEAGADSAAVVTDITLNADPEKRAAQWLAATRRCG
ncbi:thiamine phosphate synthase [Pelagibius sp.]|uniref:thiamine phosphate synthase n=1 Tax=Pelagibius sp. TaxID=1931238 RepID=UPI0026124326|nr:thiamine phosphate synthase [Pelagibius sp.]